MREPRDGADRRALLQRAYAAIDEQQARIRELETRVAKEPLAIVGLSCRFPGAGDPDAYWDLLRTATDAITEVPSDRWNADEFYDPNPDAPGRMYTRHGGFLRDVAAFDAAFFSISPREAVAMDPQQRLLLETTWDALDRAGQPRDRLAGSSTGVFIGITANEYAQLHHTPAGLSGIDAYHITGNTLNAAAGRIAYTLGFRGPAIAIDTACSSSLVAVHLACAAIRQGDCEQAIAGGVHLILSPAGHVALCKARVLSPAGRCRTFDAKADGMARGEGCGIIIIRKLSDALRDGDPLVAVIRGSAVNQDGASSGLTVPNGPAQEDVIRLALAHAGVDPLQVGYVEAHGTATPLGDPIEIKALGNALCRGRSSDSPLLVGSVKTNLGHLEAAAGIAGLIKVALALEHGEIPPHLHFETPSPQIPWSELPISVVTSPRPWTRGASPRIAGVSAFGFSGTNAHVVLEEAPARTAGGAEQNGAYVLRLAARSETAFRALAGRYAAHVSTHEEQRLGDICATANTGRAEGTERGGVVARDRAGLVAGLAMLARVETGPGVVRGRATERPRIGFLYSGQGAVAGMGHALFESEPAFRDAVDRCASAVTDLVDVDLRDVLYGAAGERLREKTYSDLGFLAVAAGLTAVWRAWGVAPWGVLGHGVGDYAAAVAAGILELDTAARLLAQSPAAFEAAIAAAAHQAPQSRFLRARAPEQWSEAVASLRAQGCTVLLEVGPRAVSTSLVQDLRPQGACDVSLRGGADARAELLESAATLYVAGARIDWAATGRAADRRRVVLPTYPWQHERFWLARPAAHAAERPAPVSVAAVDARDPLLDWSYEVTWQELGAPIAGEPAGPLPSGRAIERRLEPHVERLRADAGAVRYSDALEHLETRAVGYAARALARMGLDPLTHPPFNAGELAARLGVDRAYRPLFDRMLEMIEEAGWPDASEDESLDDTVARYPEAEAEFRILDRCGRALPDVLCEARDPLGLLFPSDGSFSAAHLYSDSPAARLMNGLVAHVIRAVAHDRPSAPLRMLEIGAGTGGTTASILPVLLAAPLPTEYAFTDVSTVFLAQARDRFPAASFLRTARLDIEVPPLEQGFTADGYDVVVAANVLHATQDLGRSLDHAAELLAPGGLLVLQEWTGSSYAIDLMFGLTRGWWRFADREVRTSHPLISAERWQALLGEHGFDEVGVIGSTPLDRGVLAKQAVIVARKKAPVGRWIVLGDRGGTGERVHAALVARGSDAVLVGADSSVLPGMLARGTGHGPVIGITDLRALDAPAARDLSGVSAQRSAERVCGDLLQLVQSLAHAASSGCQLHVVTRAALSIAGECPDGVAQSPLWGVGKVVSLEHPELQTRLIDLDAVTDAAHAIAGALDDHVGETQVAFRHGRRWVPRLIPHRPAHARTPIRFDGNGAYLVTGGFGGLGLLLADWLASKGAGLIVLTGRRAPTPAATDAIRAIEQRGGRVLVRQADVADPDQVTAVLDEVRRTGARVAGIFHAAGVLDDGILLQLDAKRFSRVLRPKVEGAWNLHAATRADRPEAFVLFSAATSMFGSAGQANHAAANAFLDALAAYRRAGGLPALSINWGAWARVGAASGADVAERIRMKGLRAIDPEHGLAVLERLMQGEAAQVGVFGVDWDAIPVAMKGLPFLARVVERPLSTASGAATLVAEFQAAPAHRRRPLLAAHVRGEIRRVLALGDSAPIDMKRGLFDLGFDSLTSMELRNRLQTTCGCTLPSTLVFDYPTPEAVVDQLMALLSSPPAAPGPEDDVADLLGRKLAELRESLGS